MKKSMVKQILYDCRGEMIDEIDDQKMIEGLRDKVKTDDFLYGYKVGVSQASMILLNWIIKTFPEEEYDPED